MAEVKYSKKNQNCSDFCGTWYPGVFSVNWNSKLKNSKWRIEYGALDLKKLNSSDCYGTWYLGIFWLAEYEDELKIAKFKMAGTIWRSKIFKKIKAVLTFMIFGTQRYFWPVKIYSCRKIQNGGSNMALQDTKKSELFQLL